jgi:hypothetical protein
MYAYTMQKIEFYNNLYCLYIKKNTVNMFVVFLSARGKTLWEMVAHVGNKYNRYFMSPSYKITAGTGAVGVNVSENTLVVVLDTMTAEEINLLKNALFKAFLFVVEVSEVELAELEKGSELRMRKYLYSNTFELPPSNQWHFVLSLCQHAGVNPDTLPGVVSVANAELAVKHVLCYTLWGAATIMNAVAQTIRPSRQ